MSVEARAFTAPEPAVDALAAQDLFTLGRQAGAARDARLGRRGTFVRARQLLAGGAWRGPRDAAESYVEAGDLPAIGGLAAARAAGVGLFVGADRDEARGAAAAGLRVVLRLPFQVGEDDRTRLAALAAIDAAGFEVWGLLPTPAGEPYGLDTLRLFALARLALPRAPHLLADVGTLGPRLAQMVFGFGADELFAPIVSERALRLGANAHNPALTRKEAATLIRGAGLTPGERFADGTIEEVSA